MYITWKVCNKLVFDYNKLNYNDFNIPLNACGFTQKISNNRMLDAYLYLFGRTSKKNYIYFFKS